LSFETCLAQRSYSLNRPPLRVTILFEGLSTFFGLPLSANIQGLDHTVRKIWSLP
jgi:hypothetical protein